jgi:hypothetical protein
MENIPIGCIVIWYTCNFFKFFTSLVVKIYIFECIHYLICEVDEVDI